MINLLLSTFWGGLLYTAMFFAISFVAVLFFKLCVYYVKTKTAPAPQKEEPKENPVAEEKKKEPRPRARRRVHTIEIRPDEINRIYVAEKKNAG